MRVVLAVVFASSLFWAAEGALKRQKALEEKREEQLEELLERFVERLDDDTEQGRGKRFVARLDDDTEQGKGERFLERLDDDTEQGKGGRFVARLDDDTEQGKGDALWHASTKMRVVLAVVFASSLFWAAEGALKRQKALEEKREEQREELLERFVERLDDDTEQDDAVLEEKALMLEPIEKSLEQVSGPCCAPGSTTVDLRNGGVFVTGGGVGQVLVQPAAGFSESCSHKALLKVSFAKLPPCISGCVSYPLCGRSMLRVDLDLHSTSRSASGHLFNVGDSVSNDGYGGDGNDQTNDAEIEAINQTVYVRASDNCPTLAYKLLATYADAVKLVSVNRVTLFISNEHVRITNNNGLNQIICNKCLFALNGQSDLSSGGVNEDIYIALNRVITGYAGRNGYGVCSAKLSWVCPEIY